MTGSHSSKQTDDVTGEKKVSWNLMSGSCQKLLLGIGYSGAAPEPLTPKQPTSRVQAPVLETQDIFVTDKVVQNGEGQVGDSGISESHHLKDWGRPANSGSGGKCGDEGVILLLWSDVAVSDWSQIWQDSRSGPFGILGSLISWLCRHINAKYPPSRLGLCRAGLSQTILLRQARAQEENSPWKPQDGPEMQRVGPNKARGWVQGSWLGLFLATCQNPPNWVLEAHSKMAIGWNHHSHEPLVHFFYGSLWSWVSWGLTSPLCYLWVCVRKDVQASPANSEILKKCLLWIFSILSLTWS